jgi:hypothetical protein
MHNNPMNTYTIKLGEILAPELENLKIVDLLLEAFEMRVEC